MHQKEEERQFNRQLDRLLSGKALDTYLSLSDQRALELARRLSMANFSSESCVRDDLYLRLIKSDAFEPRLLKVSLPHINFSTWVWTALVLMVFLVHSIETSSPQPALIATSLPAHVVLAEPSPSVTLASSVIKTQALKPVPIPTPQATLAIADAQNQPSLVSNSSNLPWYRNPDQTQTPHTSPLPQQGNRP